MSKGLALTLAPFFLMASCIIVDKPVSEVSGSITVGDSPEGLAYDYSKGEIFVTDVVANEGTVSNWTVTPVWTNTP